MCSTSQFFRFFLYKSIYAALVLGTRDYVHKCGFDRVLIGMSGGIDSSLVATVAVDALGEDNVIGVTMPSLFSSKASIFDSQELADNLSFELMEISIEQTFDTFLKTLKPQFKNTELDVAEENIQSRIRGNLLMALSNKFDWLVLTTGNKSEISVGYATLYGDMAGGFALLKDVLKGWVYRLSNWRNQDREVIPVQIIDKPPTAELREHQFDTDNLPPYSTLDAILEAYIETNSTPVDIVRTGGHDPALVDKVINMVDRAEYKRRQAPPGIRISPLAFGRDRRHPITNRYRKHLNGPE